MADHASPLLITLALDEASQLFFDAIRDACFPRERNYLKAHLTLFHHLPRNQKVEDDLLQWSAQQAVMELTVPEVKSIGKGVAYKIQAPELVQLHRLMQARWRPWLKPQDKQQLWPHITVQNKVTVTEARQTLAALQASFTPFVAKGTGLQLWSYQGGPWEFIKLFPFTA